MSKTIIRKISDVHFEFFKTPNVTPELCEIILPTLPTDGETVLILAGDMCKLKNTKPFRRFLDVVHTRFPHILYVLGNHEYYDSNYDKVQHKLLDEKYKYLYQYDNVTILDDETVTINDITFIGSTLWTDCDKGKPLSEWNISKNMNDFYVIKRGEYGKSNFTTSYMISLFHKHLNFLQNEIQNAKGTTVVITHHAPSTKSIDKIFQGSNINGGFMSDLSEFILDYAPDYWFHGHMHNSSNYMIDKTNVISNPRGYPKAYSKDPSACENGTYNPELILTI